jgi:hypothetical protein
MGYRGRGTGQLHKWGGDRGRGTGQLHETSGVGTGVEVLDNYMKQEGWGQG